MKQVTVVKHPETGNVITPSTKNTEWGSIRVDSKTTSMENGILNISNRVAFIRGKIKDLESLDLKDGSKLTGIIQKYESFNPFYEGQTPKINPSNGEVVLKNGKETFLQFVYTSDVNAPVDVFINEEAVEIVDASMIQGQTL